MSDWKAMDALINQRRVSMEPRWGFESFMAALCLFCLCIWLRVSAAMAAWHVHLVPMGAPPVQWWWMFWALATLSLFMPGHASGAGSKPKSNPTTTIVSQIVYAACYGLAWFVFS
jgi:hypothetical protein